MAIMYIREGSQGSTELYDRVRERLKDEQPPEGFIFHVAATPEGGGLCVVEIWESEEALKGWIQKVDAAIEQVGAPPRPQARKYAVHNIITPAALSRT